MKGGWANWKKKKKEGGGGTSRYGIWLHSRLPPPKGKVLMKAKVFSFPFSSFLLFSSSFSFSLFVFFHTGMPLSTLPLSLRSKMKGAKKGARRNWAKRRRNCLSSKGQGGFRLHTWNKQCVLCTKKSYGLIFEGGKKPSEQGNVEFPVVFSRQTHPSIFRKRRLYLLLLLFFHPCPPYRRLHDPSVRTQHLPSFHPFPLLLPLSNRPAAPVRGEGEGERKISNTFSSPKDSPTLAMFLPPPFLLGIGKL